MAVTPQLARIASAGACLLTGLAVVLAEPASAFDIWPDSSDTLGPISWAGWVIDPDAGFETVSFGGTGGTQLKDAEGLYAGGFIGRDFEMGPLVIGASANLAYSWIDGTGTAADASPLNTDLKYFGFLRGRVGLPVGRLLAFGTAGWSYGEFEVFNARTSITQAQGLSGLVYGGGLEFVWNRSITLKGEYLHVDFGDATFSNLPPASATLEPEMELWKFGAVHRF